ncbi:hypothetical protein MKX01_021921 [Papaver californicum]|nr:hypothetical protein MKX01_021921 [Papaver californicum]
MFFPNGTTVYSLPMSTSDLTGDSSRSGLFCVAKPDADSSALKSCLDWACGQGSANCGALQAGQPCFQPNNIQSHFSYAYNDYFHRMQSAGGTCDFGGHGSCIFMGSSRSNSSGPFMPPAAPGPFIPGKSGSKMHFSGITYMVLTALVALIQL